MMLFMNAYRHLLSHRRTTHGALAGIVVALSLTATLAACSSSTDTTDQRQQPPTSVTAQPTMGVEVVATHPFDQSSFTQGLEVDGDSLLIGTGQEGESRVYRSSLDGKEQQSVPLDREFFGEGVTRAGDHVWQLTWRHGTAVKRDAASLDEVARTSYSGEGWGLCSFGDRLIMSDGTSQLRILDPDTFVERERIQVTRDGAPLDKLNELDCTDGRIYANRFLTSEIVRIDAASGTVTDTIDASTLASNAAPDPNNVLNGIAHIPGTDRFLVGGKRWPQLYEVRFVPR